IEANGDEDGWVEIGSDTFPFAVRVTTVQAGDNVVEFSSNNASAIYATSAAPCIDTGEGGHHHHGGACFIATAAYGTPLDGQIDTLRSVRDRFMIGNP